MICQALSPASTWSVPGPRLRRHHGAQVWCRGEKEAGSSQSRSWSKPVRSHKRAFRWTSECTHSTSVHQEVWTRTVAAAQLRVTRTRHSPTLRSGWSHSLPEPGGTSALRPAAGGRPRGHGECRARLACGTSTHRPHRAAVWPLHSVSVGELKALGEGFARASGLQSSSGPGRHMWGCPFCENASVGACISCTLFCVYVVL